MDRWIVRQKDRQMNIQKYRQMDFEWHKMKIEPQMHCVEKTIN